jgi:hypothetical protein
MEESGYHEPSRAPLIAAAATLGIGLFFIFVWAPHPWGWNGIDQYHSLALALARGEGFQTTDVPWGYAYFLAGFYRLFGDHPWIPLVAQAVLNMLVPIFTYQLVRDLIDRRTASIAALLVGVFSFNTVYVSTQSTDSVCTVLFLAGVLGASRAAAGRGRRSAALAGLALGAAAQFRPNLILFPAVWVAWTLWRSPRVRRVWIDAAIILALSTAVDVPWIVHNYRLTGQFIPTSTHGGMQLWYGALQSGSYSGSRARNPASAFETPSFDYTALPDTPINVWGEPRQCPGYPTAAVALLYWTDRDRTPRRLNGVRDAPDHWSFEIPGQPLETAIYYYFDASGASVSQTTPRRGAADPRLFFVSHDHTGDLDRHDDLLDAFDVARLLRHVAWGEPAGSARLDLDGDGAIGERDLRLAVALLLDEPGRPDRIARLERGADRAAIVFANGTRFEMPRRWSARITDVTVTGEPANKLVYAHRSFATGAATDLPHARVCQEIEAAGINDLFSRREPQQMRRYTALALDYIGRHPVDFARASLYRVLRVFVIVPSDDPWATYRYRGSRAIYAGAMIVSLAYFTVFLAGVALALRARRAAWQLMLPVIYIPATLCYVLTNMRYTVTVQPFMFAFIALALAAWRDRRREAVAGPRRGETRTARQP